MQYRSAAIASSAYLKKSLKFKGFDFPEAISLLPPSDVQFRLKQVEKAEIGGRSGRHARVARR